MPKFQGGYAISIPSQFLVHLSCASKQLWHCHSYQFVVMVICCVMSLFSGWVIHGVGMETTADFHAVISITFFSMTVISTSYFQMALPFYFCERIAFYREQSSRMYHPLPWGFAYLLAELPYSIFITFLYLLIYYVSVELILIVIILSNSILRMS